MNLKYNKNFSQKLREYLESDTREARIATVALCVLAVASMPVIVGVGMAMGNAVQIFKKYKRSSRYTNRQIYSAIQSAKRQKLVECVSYKDGSSVVRVTKKGERKLRVFAIDLMKIKIPRKWDGKWRLVLYDLPVRFSKSREALRYHLKNLGFYQLQKSAWIHPYPCEDEIIFIADYFAVGKYVEVLTVEDMLHDEKIKKHFGLN